MNPVFETENAADNKVGQLKAILFLLQTNVEQFKDELDRSYALLDIGEMTEFSKKLLDQMNNPMQSLLETHDKIEEQVVHVVDIFANNFFRLNKDVLESVYKTYRGPNSLSYNIILNHDNRTNRSKILSFFDHYNSIFDRDFPVYFQFIPKDIAPEISNKGVALPM